MYHVFLDIGLIIIASSIVALLAKRLKQPVIPAYIVAGLIIGPGITYLSNLPFIAKLFNIENFRLIANNELIWTLSEVGVALLLFIVGLEINLKSFKEVEKVTSYGSLINIFLLYGLGFVIATIFGFSTIEAIYLAFIGVFSSTMVIVKILSDKREVDSLHGKIMIGFLLVEDLVAIFALLVLTTLKEFSFLTLIGTLVIAALTIAATLLLSKLFLPKIFTYIADSKDMLFLVSLGICFLFSLIFSKIGFSIAIGSFIAGIIIGNLPYNFEIIGRIRSLRDFFATLFFVSLGMQMEFKEITSLLPYLFVVMLLVLFMKPLITMLTVGAFGYRKYTSFKVGISLTQVSEFSLILFSQGMLLGYVSKGVFSLVILLAIITMALTTYTMKHELGIYKKIQSHLHFLEHHDKLHKTKHHYKKFRNNIILCGCDRMGRSILSTLLKSKKTPVVVDYNPSIIRKLQEQKIPAMYGDVSNEEIIEQLNLKNAKILINTVRNQETSLTLIKEARKLNNNLLIIDCANRINEALELYENGADYVILPNFLGGDYISFLLGDRMQKIKEKGNFHKKELEIHLNHFLEDKHINPEHHD